MSSSTHAKDQQNSVRNLMLPLKKVVLESSKCILSGWVPVFYSILGLLDQTEITEQATWGKMDNFRILNLQHHHISKWTFKLIMWLDEQSIPRKIVKKFSDTGNALHWAITGISIKGINFIIWRLKYLKWVKLTFTK